VKVARTNEVEAGPARLVAVKSREIALFNIDGQFFALANACTHENGASAEGEIWDREVTCPLHGATFDIRQGEVLTPPAYEAVAAYRVRVTEPTSRSRFRDQRRPPPAERDPSHANHDVAP
jgi:3-phenylpropionate/trans-cinnamate dioxygenase ferredoxin subunit